MGREGGGRGVPLCSPDTSHCFDVPIFFLGWLKLQVISQCQTYTLDIPWNLFEPVWSPLGRARARARARGVGAEWGHPSQGWS